MHAPSLLYLLTVVATEKRFCFVFQTRCGPSPERFGRVRVTKFRHATFIMLVTAGWRRVLFIVVDVGGSLWIDLKLIDYTIFNSQLETQLRSRSNQINSLRKPFFEV